MNDRSKTYQREIEEVDRELIKHAFICGMFVGLNSTDGTRANMDNLLDLTIEQWYERKDNENLNK